MIPDEEPGFAGRGFAEVICKVRFLANPRRSGDGWRIGACDLGRSIRNCSFHSSRRPRRFHFSFRATLTHMRDVYVRLCEITRIQHVLSCAIHVQNLSGASQHNYVNMFGVYRNC